MTLGSIMPRRLLALLLCVGLPGLLGVSGCSSIGLGRGAGGSKPPVSASSKNNQPGATSKNGGFYMDDGPAADAPANLDAVPDAIPVAEPLSRGANKPYNVFGVDYVPQTDLSTPYRQRGVGSWYGRKFHGQKTSSGEIYNMFGMTAAHPTLPIPSYVRVTNVKNGKSVVVRVNDRGPFLHGRLIDLSYAAAYKLGYVNNGSSELEVEKFTPELIAAYKPGSNLVLAPLAAASVPVPSAGSTPQVPADSAPVATSYPTTDPISAFAASTVVDINPVTLPEQAQTTVATDAGKGFYLQLGAFGQRDNADTMVRRIGSEPGMQTTQLVVKPFKSLFKVLAGPYGDRMQAQAAAQKIQSLLSLEPLVLQP